MGSPNVGPQDRPKWEYVLEFRAHSDDTYRKNRQAQSYPQRCYGLTYVTLPGLMGSHSRVIRFAPHDGAKFMSPRFHRGNCRGVFMCAAYIAVFVWSFRPLVDPGFRPGPAYDALPGLRRMSPFPDSARTQIISIFQSLVQ